MKIFKLFPTIEEVFQDPTEEYKTVFFPLLSIDLSYIKKGTGKIHFITVFPSGREEFSFPNDKFGYNYIKFKLINGKYLFEGNIKEMPLIDKTIDWYKEAEDIYQERKEKYFIKEEDDRRRKVDFNYSFYIEGVINYWVTRDKFLETGKFIQGSAFTHGNFKQERNFYENFENYNRYNSVYFEDLLQELSIQINALSFIGTITGFNYSKLGENEISLFIISETHEVLQYFNWS